jgi:hypothetical protein
MLSDSLGPLPDHLYALWTRSSRYYTNRGVQFNTLLYEPSDGTDLLANKMKPLEEFFDEHRAVGVSDEEARTVKATLRWILQYDPAKRPTPSQILQNPWFRRRA